MFLKSLYLRNFRNYTEAQIHFGPRINVISGANAQGKTNLLEAIYLLSCGRSFRTAHLSELIQKGKSAFYLEAVIIKNDLPETLRLYFDGKTRKFQYNSTIYNTFNSLLGVMPSILHAPSDIDLISSAPTMRRRFLNIHLAQHNPLYVHHLLRYHKAMKQRNFLLKERQTDGIECWEEEMASSADYIMHQRREMLQDIQKKLRAFASTFDYLEEIEIETYSTFSSKEAFLLELQKGRKRELLYGSTLIGPHREDFQILLNKFPAKSFASEGQKESCSFSLRLAEWERLCEKTELAVLMSIDDFAVHLDDKRSEIFQQSLQSFQ